LLALDAATGYRESHRWIVWLLPVAGFLVGWVYLKIGQGVEAGNNLLIDEIHDPQKVVPLAHGTPDSAQYCDLPFVWCLGGARGYGGADGRCAGRSADRPFPGCAKRTGAFC
jgi:hypothetical protein